MKRVLAFFGILGLVASLGFAGDYTIDKSHANIGFGVKHLSISTVNGFFGEFDGKLSIDEKSKTLQSLEGSIKVASINTNNPKRDEHLRDVDFFDATKYPDGTLSLKKLDGNKLYADLTLRGVKKEVVFDYTINGPIKHPQLNKNLAAIKLSGKINRKDFGIAPKTPDTVISDEILINIEFEALSK